MLPEMVRIDEGGVYKYVIVLAHKDEEQSYHLVRGSGLAEYHDDIFQVERKQLEPYGYHCECVGGGRIRFDAGQKEVHIYGYSKGYGRANHSHAAEEIQKKYPDFKVTWSNDGY